MNMEGIKRRKKSGGSSASTMKSNAKGTRRLSSPYNLLRFLFFIFAFCLASLSILVMLNNSWPLKNSGHNLNILDRFTMFIGLQTKTYAVVIDAGSTGSRVLAFAFCRALTDNTLKLDNELWREVKPGLSSYADNPMEAGSSLLPLLESAREFVPEKDWSSTPLILKATAGLRLLDKDKAQAILYEVGEVIKGSGFYTNDNSIGIMDSDDEGIFSWFTVNYLLDRISGPIHNTLVALDLGGGSSQISFIPEREETVKLLPKDDLSDIHLFHKNVKILTKSYLGLGLMAARAAILELHIGNSSSEVHSPCINPIIDMEWDYGDKHYNVKGSTKPKYLNIVALNGRLGEKRPIADFVECSKTCVNVLKRQVATYPSEVSEREVIAFSYFFDRAVERGIIDPYEGGETTVLKLLREANATCEIPNVEQPFACLDLTFIANYLHMGYGFQPNTKIKLHKKINGHEISWALGLAFHVINNGL